MIVDKDDIQLVREATGAGLIQAKEALAKREGIVEYAIEYCVRTGLAIGFKEGTTQESKDAWFYPKWTAYKKAQDL